jgi:bifunctional aspartokinase / homoserine dehydrogenase 1
VSFVSGVSGIPVSGELSGLPEEHACTPSRASLAAPQVLRAPSVGHFPRHYRLHPHREHDKPLQVMKFGGTSVGNAAAISKVLEIVRDAQQDRTVLVVVSAMAGVTDLLIEAALAMAEGNAAAAEKIFADLLHKHRAAAEILLASRTHREHYERHMQECLAEVEELCQGVLNLRQLTLKTRDFISSLGERLCAPLVAAALMESGVAAEAIDARECLITDSQHGSAKPLHELTRNHCQKRISPLLREGIVPVVTGFLGATLEGALTTLGRGGSDYSASILGAALDAQEVIIWTDVNGFLTSDPRLVPEACTIPQISYRQAAALAYFGAKVLHPKTLQPVIQRRIPVWIRNTFSPEYAGTKITLEGPEREAGVKALAVMKDLSLITVTVEGIAQAPDAMRRACAAVSAAHGDMVLTVRTHSPRKFGLVVRAALAETTMQALRNEFGAAGSREFDLAVRNGLSLVTLVSQNLRDLSTIARQAFTALGQENLQVLAGSQSASGCNISFVVDPEEMPRILVRLHREFRLEKLDAEFLAAD